MKWLGRQISAGARAWVEVWDHRERASSLAMVRICVGLVLLVDLLHARHLGLVEALWAPPPDGFSTASVKDAPFMIRHFGAGVDTAWLTWGLTVGACVAVITGAFTRVACVLLALMSAQLAYMAPDGDRGIDKLLRVTLLVLALSKSHAVWTVDALVWRRLFKRPIDGASGLIPAWPRYLLFLQIIWVYFIAGVAKLFGGWNPLEQGLGTLGRVLTDPHMAALDGDAVAKVWPLSIAFTTGTLLFEVAAPVWILVLYWARTPTQPGRLRRWNNKLRLRWIFFVSGIGLHLGIAFSLRLGIFPFGCLAFYPLLVWPDEWSALWRKVTRRGPPPTAPAVQTVAASAGAAADAAVGIEAEAEAGTVAETATDTGSDTGTESGSDTGTESGSESGSDTGTESDAGTDAGTDAEPSSAR